MGLGVKAEASEVSTTSTDSVPKPIRSSVAYRSKHLWSKRSLFLESQLQGLLSDAAPHFTVADFYRVGVKCGIGDTFFAHEGKRLLRIYSSWMHLSQEFVLSKVCLIMTCYKSSFAQDTYIANEVETEVIPLAVDAATSSLPPTSIPSSSPVQAVLKAITVDDTCHLRPLLTAGDLHLALHELVDESIFKEGCVILPDVIPGPLKYHNSKTLYRFSYTLGAPNVSWITLTCVFASLVVIYSGNMH